MNTKTYFSLGERNKQTHRESKSIGSSWTQKQKVYQYKISNI